MKYFIYYYDFAFFTTTLLTQ